MNGDYYRPRPLASEKRWGRSRGTDHYSPDRERLPLGTQGTQREKSSSAKAYYDRSRTSRGVSNTDRYRPVYRSATLPPSRISKAPPPKNRKVKPRPRLQLSEQSRQQLRSWISGPEQIVPRLPVSRNDAETLRSQLRLLEAEMLSTEQSSPKGIGVGTSHFTPCSSTEKKETKRLCSSPVPVIVPPATGASRKTVGISDNLVSSSSPDANSFHSSPTMETNSSGNIEGLPGTSPTTGILRTLPY